jgi:hypothetical protein
MYKRKIQARSRNQFSRAKSIGITYSVCVFVALGIQHAMRMRHIAICGLPLSTILFSSSSHKRYDFRKKKIVGHKMCVLIFSTTFI